MMLSFPTPAFPATAFDDWLNRIFSLGLVLVVATGLTLAKAFTMAIDLNDGLPTPWAILSNSSNTISPPVVLTTFDEENFVPWPSILPEPAAGPESTDGLAPDNDNLDQSLLDPSELTDGETLALQQLAARRKALDEREQLLEMRAELNGRAETRLDRQIDKLTELKTQLEALMESLDETEELKLARLVKIYETMKPKAAAEIFNRLEIPVLLHVIERMKEVKSAAVLGKMDPAIAKRVTTELAKKKERPTLAGSKAGDEA